MIRVLSLVIAIMLLGGLLPLLGEARQEGPQPPKQATRGAQPPSPPAGVRLESPSRPPNPLTRRPPCKRGGKGKPKVCLPCPPGRICR